MYLRGRDGTIKPLQTIKSSLKELNLPWAETIVHIPFGLITLNGKKLSTRKGKSSFLKAC